MGYKWTLIKKGKVLLTTLCVTLLMSCTNNFLGFENADISYQICPGKTDIVTLKRTNGNGPYSLQLYRGTGKLVEDVTIATPFSFSITNCNYNSIEICYYVSKSDLIFFIPSFNTYKDNPSKVGNYRLTYTYKVYDESISETYANIDSIYINKSDTTAILFNKNIPVHQSPIRTLFVYQGKIIYYQNSGTSQIEFKSNDSTLITKYLNDIIRIYTP